MAVDKPVCLSNRKRKRGALIEVSVKDQCYHTPSGALRKVECVVKKIDERHSKALIRYKQKTVGTKRGRMQLSDAWVSLGSLKLKGGRSAKRSRKTNATPSPKNRQSRRSAPGGGTVSDEDDDEMNIDESPIQEKKPKKAATPSGRKPRSRNSRVKKTPPSRKSREKKLLTPLNNRGRDDTSIVESRATNPRTRPNSLSPTLERSFQVNLTFTRERSESPMRDKVESGEVARTRAWKGLDRDAKIRRVQDSLVTRECKVKMAAGRENERKTLQDFITKNLRAGTGGSLYICGSPGTGKSATLQQTKKELPELIKAAGLDKRQVEVVLLNGFNMNKPQEVYVRLLDAIQRRRSNMIPRKAGEVLAGIFQNDGWKNQRYIVVVDEIDGLLQKSQRVLYTLFSWPMQPRSNLLLIGIANSMNITDRFLPKLESRKCAPQTLVFKPYTKADLKAIVQQRLLPFQEDTSDPYGPFFEESAVRRLVHKIGGISGDVRKTLELCRHALDHLLSHPEEKRVTFATMTAILREHYQSPFSQIIQDLPFFGQAMVSCFVHFFAKRSPASLSQLRAFYYHLTKEYSVPAVPTPDEFNEIFANLASQGILCPVGKKKRTFAKKRKGALTPDSQFEFCVQKDDVLQGVETNPVLANLLSFQAAIPSKIL